MRDGGRGQGYQRTQEVRGKRFQMSEWSDGSEMVRGQGGQRSGVRSEDADRSEGTEGTELTLLTMPMQPFYLVMMQLGLLLA